MKGRVVQLAHESSLAPELKDFVDRAIVPILVRGYLEVRTHEKQIADRSENVALCDSMAGSTEAEALG